MQPIRQQQPQIHLHGNDGDGDGDLDAMTTLSQNKLSISSPSSSDPVLLIPTHHQLLHNQESVDSNFPSLAAKPFTMCAANPSITCIPYAIFSATDATSCWSSHFQHFSHSHPELSASYNQQQNLDQQEGSNQNHQQADQQTASRRSVCDGTPQRPNLSETTRWSQESLEDGQDSKDEGKHEEKDLSGEYGLPARHQSAVFMSSSFSNSESFCPSQQLLQNPVDQASYQYFSSQMQINQQPQQMEQHNKMGYLDQGSSHILTSPYPGVTPSKVLLRFPAPQPAPAFSSIIIQDPMLAPYSLNAFQTPSASSLFQASNFPHFQSIATSKIMQNTIAYENCHNPIKSEIPTLYPGLPNFQADVTSMPQASSTGPPVVAEFFPTIYVSPLGIIEVSFQI